MRAETARNLLLASACIVAGQAAYAGAGARIQCPELGYYANPDIEVRVSLDARDQSYIYEYSLLRNSGDRRGIALFKIESDANDVGLVSTFDQGGVCTTSGSGVSCLNSAALQKPQSTFTGLKIRSRYPPGVVSYFVQSVGDERPLRMPEVERAALMRQFGGNEEAFYEAVDEAVQQQCPYGARLWAERVTSGVTVGPSRDKVLDGVDGISLERIAVPDVSSRVTVKAQSNRTLYFSDSAGHSIQRSELAELSSPKHTKCNIKGMIVTAALDDGVRAKAGFKLPADECNIEDAQFLLAPHSQ